MTDGVARVRAAPGNADAVARVPTRGARVNLTREAMGSARAMDIVQ